MFYAAPCMVQQQGSLVLSLVMQWLINCSKNPNILFKLFIQFKQCKKYLRIFVPCQIDFWTYDFIIMVNLNFKLVSRYQFTKKYTVPSIIIIFMVNQDQCVQIVIMMFCMIWIIICYHLLSFPQVYIFPSVL